METDNTFGKEFEVVYSQPDDEKKYQDWEDFADDVILGFLMLNPNDRWKFYRKIDSTMQGILSDDLISDLDGG